MMSCKETVAKEIPCEAHVWLYNWGLVWGGTRRSLQYGGVRKKGQRKKQIVKFKFKMNKT